MSQSECQNNKCDITKNAPTIKRTQPLEKKPKVHVEKESKGFIHKPVECNLLGKGDDACTPDKVNKIEIITQKNCSWCETAKKDLGAEVMRRINEIDAYSPRGKVYGKYGYVNGTPSFVLNEKTSCELMKDDATGQMSLECKDKSKIILKE